MREQSRCHRCGRILFLTKDNRLPPHKVPERKDGGSVPLTGKHRPWCGA